MTENRRNEPATEPQKDKLRFFGCTWDDGIMAGQATDALTECAKLFPDREAAWQLQKADLLKVAEILPESTALTTSTVETTVQYLERTGLIHDPAWQCWINAKQVSPSEVTIQKADAAAAKPMTAAAPASIPPPPEPQKNIEAPPHEVSIQTAKSSSAQTSARHEGFFSGMAEMRRDVNPSNNQLGNAASDAQDSAAIKAHYSPQTDSYTFDFIYPTSEQLNAIRAYGKAWDEWRIQHGRLSPQENIERQKKETAASPPVAMWCSKCRKGKLVEHNGRYWCHDCGRLVTPLDHEIVVRLNLQISSTQEIDQRAGEPEPPFYLKYSLDPFLPVEFQQTEAENRRRYDRYVAEMNLWNSQRRGGAIKQPEPFPEPPTPQNLNPRYISSSQIFAQRPSPYQPAPIPSRQSMDEILKTCPSSDGCYWLPVKMAANLLDHGQEDKFHPSRGWLPAAKAQYLYDIVPDTRLSIGLSRLIADKIEAAGYFVEPDARYGGGSYGWDQTLVLFKRNVDQVKPSLAYLGAANLLRLSVLIAAADGQIDEVELDVFRQVIENQLDLTPTDHRQLQVLEKLLVQDPSSAAKTLANVAKSIPAHKRLLIGKVLVRVAAADTVITKDERRALERIFKAFEISQDTLENLMLQACPPSQADIVKKTPPVSIPVKPEAPKKSEAELTQKQKWDEWVALQERLAERQKRTLGEATLPKNETVETQPSVRHEGFFCGSDRRTLGDSTNYDGPATPEQLSELRSNGIEAGPGLKFVEANELIESCRAQEKKARAVKIQETEPEPPAYLEYPHEPRPDSFEGISFERAYSAWKIEFPYTKEKNRQLYEEYVAEMERWNAQRGENEIKGPEAFPEPPKQEIEQPAADQKHAATSPSYYSRVTPEQLDELRSLGENPTSELIYYGAAKIWIENCKARKGSRKLLNINPEVAGGRSVSERSSKPVEPPAIRHFALDMVKVDSITNETKEVVGILSDLMADEPEITVTSPQRVEVSAPEIPQVSGGDKSAPQPSRFGGLNAAFIPILERLLTRDSWAPADFNALAREFQFMPLNIRDTLNEWSDEALGDFILDGEDPVLVCRELMTKEQI